MDAGEYYVIIDSWADAGGTVYDGDYDLAFEWIAEGSWTDVPVADGVTWSRLRSLDLAGGVSLQRQTAPDCEIQGRQGAAVFEQQ